MSVKDPAIVYVKYENGQVVLSDNEGHECPPGNLEDFMTEVKPNGKIGWQPSTGVDSITITIDSGQDIFKKLPKEKNGDWEAKIDNKHSGEAKYTIGYKINGEEKPSIDPVIRVKYP